MGKRKSGSTIVLRGKAARTFVDLLAKRLGEPVRACRLCGCTDTRACRGGCTWVAARLCSACLPTIDEAFSSLCLVSGTEHVTLEQVAAWSPDQQADAYAWAMAVHFKASDNHVDVPPRPPHTLSGVEVRS